MKPIIQYPDFDKLDIRVGKIIDVSIPSWSSKLIELKVNFGKEIGEKTIFAGIQKWYKPENLLNKKCLFIVNLAQKKMGESYSQGMMLMAEEKGKPILIKIPSLVSEGASIS